MPNFRRFRAPFAAAAALVSAFAAPSLAHADMLGAYAGGSVGRANVKLDQFTGLAGSGLDTRFDKRHVGWKVTFGVRPVAVLGGEIEYFDFGHPTLDAGALKADVKTRGEALYAVGYLPLPLPLVDVYGKAGYARVQTTANASLIGVLCTPTSPNCAGPYRFDRTDTKFAWGVGVQVKVPVLPLTVRAEYEHYDVAGGAPDFASLGVIWKF